MSGPCEVCDRAECPYIPFDKMNCDEYDVIDGDVTYKAVEDCRAHAKDWRSEALRLRTSLAAAERELDRWRHGQPVEGDYVCPEALTVDAMRPVVALAATYVDVWKAYEGKSSPSRAEMDAADDLARAVDVYRAKERL